MAKIGLPEVLKYLRRDCGLTQIQLAKETGLSLSAIVSYENGLREPNSRAMAVLERYFNVSGEYLRGGLTNDTFFTRAEEIGQKIDAVTILMQSYHDAYLFGSQSKQELCNIILGETLQFLTKSILPDDTSPTVSGEQFAQLLSFVTELNSEGQAELIKRADELTQIEKYKNPS